MKVKKLLFLGAVISLLVVIVVRHQDQIIQVVFELPNSLQEEDGLWSGDNTEVRALLPSQQNQGVISGGAAASRGFVLTLKFTGQQVAGLRGLFSQQCWLNSFRLPMAIVEPFMAHSTLVHSKEMWEEEKEKTHAMSLKLSNFYTMPTEGHTGLTISSWNYFLNFAPRKLIVVTIENVHSKKCLNFGLKSCNKWPSSPPLFKCKQLNVIKDSVSYLRAHGFQVVREVCFNCEAAEITNFSSGYVTKYIFSNYKPNDVTVLMSHWKFSFQITQSCSPQACYNFAEAFKEVQSPTNLGQVATQYNDVIDGLQGRTKVPVGLTVAVMVRLEWFIITYRDQSLEKIDSCLQTVMRTKRKLESAVNSTARVLLALDVGKFGSGSFEHTIRLHSNRVYFEAVLTKVKSIVQELYDGKLTFDTWEESYVTAAGGLTDKSYIAALQNVVVSQADCLVLVGGGHFQELALQKYKAQVPARECIHKICSW